VIGKTLRGLKNLKIFGEKIKIFGFEAKFPKYSNYYHFFVNFIYNIIKKISANRKITKSDAKHSIEPNNERNS
jgi:hypothetical protein